MRLNYLNQLNLNELEISIQKRIFFLVDNIDNLKKSEIKEKLIDVKDMLNKVINIEREVST